MKGKGKLVSGSRSIEVESDYGSLLHNNWRKLDLIFYKNCSSPNLVSNGLQLHDLIESTLPFLQKQDLYGNKIDRCWNKNELKQIKTDLCI